ncbi:MAG: CHAT domain-containing protein [Magnetococcales bacterium]|nr:CHAT domain-containing protein [Magnetococcales bacterium]
MNVTVELKIKRGAGIHIARVTRAGEPVGADRAISEADLSTLRLVVDGVRQLLRTPGPPGMAEEAIRAVGIELFHTWLAPVWGQLLPALNPGQTTTLAILSDALEILLFPWEALLPPEREPLGLDPAFAIQRRALGMPPSNRCRALSPGPLRVLFQASAPDGFPITSTTQARDAFVASLPDDSQADAPRIETTILENGTWDALRQGIDTHQPHAIHLSGPALIRGTQGFFAFEEPEDRLVDARTAQEMVHELLRYSGAGIVIVSGREQGKSPPLAATGALCLGVIGSGEFPMALAWPDTLENDAARRFFGTLMTALAQGERVDAALTRARRVLASLTAISGRPDWLLPTLYARGEQPHLFHGAFQIPQRTKWLHDEPE